ncbi:hypothetical protein [Falsiroseomonas sp. E2-1-a4]|uniref:hypothetical protein n=1 Tax=Falsiroseomonas sp. E2-1-a4 TaxID=3239299 RepID=UPI003F2C65D5
MQVEIDEVVSTIRVTDGASLDARQMHALVQTVLGAVEERLARNQRQADGVRIPDDGRGGVSRAGIGQLGSSLP